MMLGEPSVTPTPASLLFSALYSGTMTAGEAPILRQTEERSSRQLAG